MYFKKRKKILAVLLAVIMVMTSLTITPQIAEAASPRITLNKTSASIYIGKSTTIKVLRVRAIPTRSATFKSSNPKVATVSSTGVVKGIKKGTATITVTSTRKTNVTATCKITVKQQVTKIQTAKYVILKKGKTLILHKMVLPTTADNKSLTFSSNNRAVASVSSKGVITANKKGTATITVKSKDGQKSVKVAVTVVNTIKSVTSFKLNATSKILGLKKKFDLNAKVLPSNATSTRRYWISDNPAVASVDTKGIVTGLKEGTATITSYSIDGSGKKASCKITVRRLVTGVEVSPTKKTLTKIGAQTTLKATISPSNATLKTVEWKSSDKSVATVSSKGVVTAKKNGSATITAYAKDGSGKKASAKITVAVTATSVKLNKTSLKITTTGTKTLTATVNPDTTKDKTITWTSSNKSVATVSSKGVITPKDNGETTITATTSNGKKAICKVTVAFAVTKVTVSKSSLELTKLSYLTKPYQLTATVSPDKAKEPAVTWESEYPSVATVSNTGLVTAKRNGTTKITATTSNGIKGTCTVTVNIFGLKASSETYSLILDPEANSYEVNFKDKYQIISSTKVKKAYANYQEKLLDKRLTVDGIWANISNANTIGIFSTITDNSDGTKTISNPYGTTVLTYDKDNSKITAEVTVNSKTTKVTIEDISVNNVNGNKVTAKITIGTETRMIEIILGKTEITMNDLTAEVADILKVTYATNAYSLIADSVYVEILASQLDIPLEDLQSGTVANLYSH